MYLYLIYSENRNKQQIGTNQESRSGFSERLVRKALSDYCERQLPEYPAELLRETAIATAIAREEKGKPYFPGLFADHGGTPAVHYSVSHSGNWWGCLMADEPVGFDMEVCRGKVSYEKIARRFFTEEEYGLILSEGPDAFFDVWVRKEAYVKYLGTGLAEGLGSFTVAENGRLLQQVVLKKDAGRNQSTCFIRPIKIGAGVKAAYCSGSGNPVKTTITLE